MKTRKTFAFLLAAMAAALLGPAFGSSATPAQGDSYVYPNPAAQSNPVIRASVGLVTSLDITIFDSAGHPVHQNTITGAPSGMSGGQPYYEYTWGGRIASGVYFAVLSGHAPDGRTVMSMAKFAVIR